MSDLIEQWKRYKKEGIVEDNYHGFDNLIEATIEALSTPMPDDVTEVISQLNKVTNKQPNVIANATAILGRQQHTVLGWQPQQQQQQLTMLEKRADIALQKERRIEELEAEVERLEFLEEVYPESVMKRVDLQAKVTALEKLKKHMPIDTLKLLEKVDAMEAALNDVLYSGDMSECKDKAEAALKQEENSNV